MPIVYACKEGATLNNAGNCRNFEREWREIDLTTTSEYVFNGELVQIIVGGSLTVFAIGFGIGVMTSLIRKAGLKI